MLIKGDKQFQGVQLATWRKWFVLETRAMCPQIVLLTYFTVEPGLAA